MNRIYLTSIPEKILGKIIKQQICKHLEMNKANMSLLKTGHVRQSLLLSLTTVTKLVDQGNAVDISQTSVKHLTKLTTVQFLINQKKYGIDRFIGLEVQSSHIHPTHPKLQKYILFHLVQCGKGTLSYTNDEAVHNYFEINLYTSVENKCEMNMP